MRCNLVAFILLAVTTSRLKGHPEPDNDIEWKINDPNTDDRASRLLYSPHSTRTTAATRRSDLNSLLRRYDMCGPASIFIIISYYRRDRKNRNVGNERLNCWLHRAALIGTRLTESQQRRAMDEKEMNLIALDGQTKPTKPTEIVSNEEDSDGIILAWLSFPNKSRRENFA